MLSKARANFGLHWSNIIIEIVCHTYLLQLYDIYAVFHKPISSRAAEVENPCTTYHVHRVFKFCGKICSRALFLTLFLSLFIAIALNVWVCLCLFFPCFSWTHSIWFTEGMFQFLFCRRITTNMCIRWKNARTPIKLHFILCQRKAHRVTQSNYWSLK